MNENLVLAGFVLVVFIGTFAWIRDIRRSTAELRKQRLAEDARIKAAAAELAAIAMQPRICGNCVHFDYELGQREMQRAIPFASAAAHVPPWRMGRVMKTDEKGEYLPLREQGIPAKALNAEWSDFGACQHTERLISKGDSCEQFERRELIPTSSLIRPPAAS